MPIPLIIGAVVAVGAVAYAASSYTSSSGSSSSGTAQNDEDEINAENKQKEREVKEKNWCAKAEIRVEGFAGKYPTDDIDQLKSLLVTLPTPELSQVFEQVCGLTSEHGTLCDKIEETRIRQKHYSDALEVVERINASFR